MIGDPTDKLAARKKLTREEVLENAKAWKKQASMLLDFGGSNPAQSCSIPSGATKSPS